MTKPNKSTRANDQYRRQLKVLEMYLTGRMRQLDHIAKNRPAEAAACEMARAELDIVLTQVVPQMREVKS